MVAKVAVVEIVVSIQLSTSDKRAGSSLLPLPHRRNRVRWRDLGVWGLKSDDLMLEDIIAL